MGSYYDAGSFLSGLGLGWGLRVRISTRPPDDGHSDGPRIHTLSDECPVWPSEGPKVAFGNWKSVLQRLRPHPDLLKQHGF